MESGCCLWQSHLDGAFYEAEVFSSHRFMRWKFQEG